MPDEKRVVAVRRLVPKKLTVDVAKPNKAQRRAYSEAMRADGKKFHNFWWDESLFGEFAKKCESMGIKPNEYLWGMIQKDMGWSE